jgi:hypothetical protein
MATSIYDEKLVPPTDVMLAYDLGAAKQWLDEIADFIATEYGKFSTEWKFYNQTTGWIMKMFTKKRNVLFVAPGANAFKVAFTLGQRATDVVLNTSFPASIHADLLAAKPYMEGRTFIIDVTSPADLEHIFQLIRIKLAP